jgi:glycine oxidase
VEDAGFDERSTLEGVSQLTRAAAELLPGTTRASVEAIRVGLRPATPDDLPIIGPLPGAPRVIAATGHYRNGILLAPITAEIVKRLVMHGEPDRALAHVTPARF